MSESVFVSVPSVKGKITFKKKKDAVYVLFEYERVYNAEKKYNVPKRVVIGKLNDENDRSLMIPNENYHEYFHSEISNNDIVENKRSNVLSIGTYLVINSLLKSSAIQIKMDEIFQEPSDLLIDLAAYSLVYKNCNNLFYNDYINSHPLFTNHMEVFSNSKISNIIENISFRQFSNFIKALNENSDKDQIINITYGKISGVDNIFCFEAWDNRGALVNYDIVPDDNVSSTNIISFVLKLKKLGYKYFSLTLDFANLSKDIINLSKFNDITIFVNNLNNDERNKIISSVVGTFENDKDAYNVSNRIYFKESKINSDFFGSDYYAYITFDKDKAKKDQIYYENRIHRIKNYLESLIGLHYIPNSEVTNYFSLYYDEKGKLVKYEEKNTLNDDLKYSGYNVYLSSKKFDIDGVIKYSKLNDVILIKDVFASLSSVKNQGNAFDTLCFINFIVTNIKKIIEEKCAGESINAVINELEKIKVINDGKSYLLCNSITKYQSKILQLFNLSNSDIENFALYLSQLIGENDDLSRKIGWIENSN